LGVRQRRAVRRRLQMILLVFSVADDGISEEDVSLREPGSFLKELSHHTKGPFTLYATLCN